MIERARLVADLDALATLAALAGEDRFRTRAWENAARILERMSDLEVTRRVGRGTLTEVPGIGDGIAGMVQTWARTQTLPGLEELRGRVPPETAELLDVPGLGPRRAGLLVSELGLRGLDDLEAACQDGRVAGVKGFGEKTQARILEGVQTRRRYREWFLLPAGAGVAEALEQALPARDGRLRTVGSVARRCEIVRDVDLLYEGDLDASGVAARLGLEVAGTRDDGAVRLAGAGLPVDLFTCAPGRAGVVEVLRTASVEARAVLESRARAAGIDPAAATFGSGRDFLHALGLPDIPAELLEDAWGIEAAERGALLDLIGLEDIRGTLHAHSTWSDGRSTVAEMAAEARVLRHRFLAITDHSRSAFYAGGLSAEALARQGGEIRAVAAEMDDFVLLHGVEADVLADGSLDYDDDTLASLDLVVASVHIRHGQGLVEMTDRVIRAIRNPRTSILAHPTGRLLLTREPMPLDVEAVLEACARHGVAVELNANPQRLDLDWRRLRRAAELGVTVAINTDAHDAAGLSDVRWGVAIARKAGLRREQVMNTWPVERVAAFLRRRVGGPEA